MAQQKRERKPDLGPHVPNTPNDADTDLDVRTLPKQDLNNVIRFIKRGSVDSLAVMRAGLNEEMTRLGLSPNAGLAIAAMPEGSDQVNVRGVFEWAAKIQKGDRRAKAQLLAIDATLRQRVGG